jgi:hypothetical protein
MERTRRREQNLREICRNTMQRNWSAGISICVLQEVIGWNRIRNSHCISP